MKNTNRMLALFGLIGAVLYAIADLSAYDDNRYLRLHR